MLRVQFTKDNGRETSSMDKAPTYGQTEDKPQVVGCKTRDMESTYLRMLAVRSLKRSGKMDLSSLASLFEIKSIT